MANEEIHIGMIIKHKLEAEGRTHVWLAKQLNTDGSNISKILKKCSINTDQLLKISVALNCDFFALFSAHLKNLKK